MWDSQSPRASVDAHHPHQYSDIADQDPSHKTSRLRNEVFPDGFDDRGMPPSSSSRYDDPYASRAVATSSYSNAGPSSSGFAPSRGDTTSPPTHPLDPSAGSSFLADSYPPSRVLTPPSHPHTPVYGGEVPQRLPSPGYAGPSSLARSTPPRLPSPGYANQPQYSSMEHSLGLNSPGRTHAHPLEGSGGRNTPRLAGDNQAPPYDQLHY